MHGVNPTAALKYQLVLSTDSLSSRLKLIGNLAAFPGGSQDLPNEAIPPWTSLTATKGTFLCWKSARRHQLLLD